MSDFAPTIERWLAKAPAEELERSLRLDHVRRDPDLAGKIRAELLRRERPSSGSPATSAQTPPPWR